MYGSPSQKLLTSEMKRFNVTGIIKKFAEELAEKEEKKSMKIITPHDAIRVRDLFNTPSTYFDTPYLLYDKYEWQEVDFVASNLGRGYIFYFICNRCERKVKYIYRPHEYSQILCRTCHNLRYKQPDRGIRRLSRLVHKPYLSYEEKRCAIEMIMEK